MTPNGCRAYQMILEKALDGSEELNHLARHGIDQDNVPPCMHPELCAKVMNERLKEFSDNKNNHPLDKPQNSMVLELIMMMQSCAENARQTLATLKWNTAAATEAHNEALARDASHHLQTITEIWPDFNGYALHRRIAIMLALTSGDAPVGVNAITKAWVDSQVPKFESRAMEIATALLIADRTVL